MRDMRDQFSAEVPKRCLRMEKLRKTVSVQNTSDKAFVELYRHVRSLNDSSGTHGLGIITKTVADSGCCSSSMLC